MHRRAIAGWALILVAFVFLATGAFSQPRRPAYTVIGIALFIVGFAARKRAGRGPR